MIGEILGIVDKFIPDGDQKEKLKAEVQQRQHELELAVLEKNKAEFIAHAKVAESQNAVNQEQAKNPSIFVSGARPFCIWALMALIIYHGGLRFIISDIANLAGHFTVFERADTAVWTGMLSGLLGLITARSFEKSKGVARDSM